MNFEIAYQNTLKHEGGYANVSGDRGGETYRGIARVYHPSWEGWQLLDTYKLQNGGIKHNVIIQDATLENLVKQFYYFRFWKHFNLDKINSAELATLVYDSVVHSGNRGIKFLQEAANMLGTALKVDGIIGNNTLTAINSLPAVKLHDTMKEVRLSFLRQLATGDQAKFWNGWYNRIASFPDLEKKSS